MSNDTPHEDPTATAPEPCDEPGCEAGNIDTDDGAMVCPVCAGTGDRPRRYTVFLDSLNPLMPWAPVEVVDGHRHRAMRGMLQYELEAVSEADAIREAKARVARADAINRRGR